MKKGVQMAVPKPVVLCILDGWGLAPAGPGNAPSLAATPCFDRLMATCPNATLVTHGPDVGLPTGQMGNSEVGHTNIGAGRVVAMDLGQIDLAIEDGSFATRPASSIRPIRSNTTRRTGLRSTCSSATGATRRSRPVVSGRPPSR